MHRITLVFDDDDYYYYCWRRRCRRKKIELLFIVTIIKAFNQKSIVIGKKDQLVYKVIFESHFKRALFT